MAEVANGPVAPVYPTISVAELRVVLDLAAKAPTTLGDGFNLYNLFQRLVILANQPNPIGAVVPVEAKPEADPSGEAPTPAVPA